MYHPLLLKLHMPTQSHTSTNMHTVGCLCVHYAEPLASAEYKAWMGSFAANTQHTHSHIQD